VLVTACDDKALKMWAMPSFDKRGIIASRVGHADCVRCLAKGPGPHFSLFFCFISDAGRPLLLQAIRFSQVPWTIPLLCGNLLHRSVWDMHCNPVGAACLYVHGDRTDQLSFAKSALETMLCCQWGYDDSGMSRKRKCCIRVMQVVWWPFDRGDVRQSCHPLRSDALTLEVRIPGLIHSEGGASLGSRLMFALSTVLREPLSFPGSFS